MLYIYNASAGSGKTYQLVQTYITLLLKNSKFRKNAHSSILAITFTKKATWEMKSRILKELNTLASNTSASPYLNYLTTVLNMPPCDLKTKVQQCLFDILQDYTHFNIMTVDSFFQQVVRQFAREMQLSPNFDIDLDEDKIIEEATDRFLFSINRQEEQTNTSQWMDNAVIDRIVDGQTWNPKKTIAQLSKEILSEKNLKALQQNFHLFSNKKMLKQFKDELLNILENSKSISPHSKNADHKELRKKGKTAELILKNFNELGVVTDVAEEVKNENMRKHRVPISQISAILNTIIDNSETPFIYEKIGNRISHFLLDEFQDTSELQWKNLYPLIKESNDKGESNLIVGDIKQSIYRWRNSNWHLLQHLPAQISPNTIKYLETNYRSSKIIINFNNNFFPSYCNYLTHLEKLSKLDTLPPTIEAVYNQMQQTPNRNDSNGKVVVLGLPEAATEQEKEDKISSFLLNAIENASHRSVPLHNVAVLLRRRCDVQYICSLLLQHGYNVETSEGLLLENHPTIQFLISLFQLQIDENSQIYLQQITNILPNGLTQEQKQFLQNAFNENLYDATQNIINFFNLHNQPNADIYLITFQNIMYHFINNNGSDIYEFIEYWNNHANDFVIPCSFAQNAIQVMTIHKAKGLEFDTVIIPYTNWPVDKNKKNTSHLWCQCTTDPFQQLAIYPLPLKEEMKKTYFADKYDEEMTDLAIDNTNLLYVAFTRPKEQLYICCCEPKRKEGKETEQIQNVGHIIYNIFNNKFNPITYLYTLGSSEIPYQNKQNSNKNEINKPLTYHYAPIGNRLILRSYNTPEDNNTSSILDLGNIMHKWLSHIKTKTDTNTAWQYLVNNGFAKTADKNKMDNLMQQFWQLVEPYDWFNPTWNIKCEEDIITPSGQIFRPDRLLLNEKEKKATVIDYKLGTKQLQLYVTQINNYKQILQNMGYQTQAFLVFISLNKIVNVND